MSQPPEIWNKLRDPPLRDFLGPFSMNQDELLVTGDFCNNNEFFSYNIKRDQWTKLFELSTNSDLQTADSCAVFDGTHQSLYVGGSGYLYQIHLKTETVQLISESTSIEHYPQFAIVNDKLHIVSASDIHLTYDPCEKSLVRLHEFKFHFHFQCLLHMKSRNSLLMFGIHTDRDTDIIYEFSFENNEWNQWNIALPQTLPIFMATILASTDEKYIFILGGNDGVGDSAIDCDCIAVIDVENEYLMDSSMKCPKKGSFDGIIVNNRQDDDLLVFGYVNRLYRSGYLNVMQELPHYLIQLIRNYVCNEFIHLIQKYASAEHWKINIDHIIAI